MTTNIWFIFQYVLEIKAYDQKLMVYFRKRNQELMVDLRVEKVKILTPLYFAF